MDIIPLLRRNERRKLLQLGRRSRDPRPTALRFHVVARLGLGKTSPEVAEEAGHCPLHGLVPDGARLRERRRRRAVRQAARGNGKPKTDDPFRRRVAKLLERTPEDFTHAGPHPRGEVEQPRQPPATVTSCPHASTPRRGRIGGKVGLLRVLGYVSSSPSSWPASKGLARVACGV